MFCAIKRDQHPSIQALKRGQRPRCLDRPQEQLVKRRRRDPVKHQADVIVGRDGRHPEQRLAVRSAMPALQLPLMRQERRASHEKDRESRQTDIGHVVFALTARPDALVRQPGANLLELAK